MRAFLIFASVGAWLCLNAASPVAAAPAGRRASKDALYMLLIDRSSAAQTARVRQMLDAGVPVNVRFDDADHDTPLTHAAGFGHLDVVRLLLQRGANPNARTDNGKTALWNAADADLSEFGEMTVNGPVPPTLAQRRTWTNAYAGLIRVLTARGANPNIPDQNGVTPLEVAAYRGREGAVAALLQCGANPNLRDHFGKTPLQWAAYIGFPRIVALLRAHGAWIAPPGLAGPTQRDRDERLVAAISRHDLKGSQALLAHGADANAHVNLWNRHSPYGSAIANASEEFGFQTPLLTGVFSPFIVRLLLQHGANPNAPGGEGETPLFTADMGVTTLLLARGASVNARNNRGQTPLMAAASDPNKVRLFLARGAKVKARDNEGHTALLSCHNESALQLLLASGADINDADHGGSTALMDAAEQGYGEGGVTCDPAWARVLLRHSADPNRRDRDGRTALMILPAPFGQPTSDAEYYDNDARVTFACALLWRGARRDLRDHQGRTALQIAQRSGATHLARLLHTRR